MKRALEVEEWAKRQALESSQQIPYYQWLPRELWSQYIIPYLLCQQHFDLAWMLAFLKQLPNFPAVWGEIVSREPPSPYLATQIMELRNRLLITQATGGHPFTLPTRHYDDSPRFCDTPRYYGEVYRRVSNRTKWLDSLVVPNTSTIDADNVRRLVRARTRIITSASENLSYRSGQMDGFLHDIDWTLRCPYLEDQIVEIVLQELAALCATRRSPVVIKRIKRWFLGAMGPFVKHPLCRAVFSDLDAQVLAASGWSCCHNPAFVPSLEHVLCGGGSHALRPHYAAIAAHVPYVVLLLRNPHTQVVADYVASADFIPLNLDGCNTLLCDVHDNCAATDFYSLLSAEIQRDFSNILVAYCHRGRILRCTRHTHDIIYRLLYLQSQREVCADLVVAFIITNTTFELDMPLPPQWLVDPVYSQLIVKLVEDIKSTEPYKILASYFTLLYQYARIKHPEVWTDQEPRHYYTEGQEVTDEDILVIYPDHTVVKRPTKLPTAAAYVVAPCPPEPLCGTIIQTMMRAML